MQFVLLTAIYVHCFLIKYVCLVFICLLSLSSAIFNGSILKCIVFNIVVLIHKMDFVLFWLIHLFLC